MSQKITNSKILNVVLIRSLLFIAITLVINSMIADQLLKHKQLNKLQ
jgi:hypothetical protein